jgi:hypothetical protein
MIIGRSLRKNIHAKNSSPMGISYTVGHETLTGEVSNFSTIVAWKAADGSLLWWTDYSLLRRWSMSRVELLLLLLLLRLELPLLVLRPIAPILLLLRSVNLTPRWSIHHAVLRRSTTRTTTDRGSRHHHLPLLLLGLSNDLHHPLLINDSTRQVTVGHHCYGYNLTYSLELEFDLFLDCRKAPTCNSCHGFIWIPIWVFYYSMERSTSLL